MKGRKSDGWHIKAEMRKLEKRRMGTEAAVLEMGSGAMLNRVCDQ